MTVSLLLALAQLNPVMGDVAGNIAKLQKVRAEAATRGAHLLMTPELYLCGYPPQDLVVKPNFQKTIRDAVEAFAQTTNDGGPAVLLGAPWVDDGKLYNAALLLDQGRIIGKTYKRDLPNYGSFDEKRIFTAGPLPEPIAFRDVKLGVIVCEDMWTSAAAVHLSVRGAEILLSPNGSPYETNKHALREEAARQRVREASLPLVYLNQVGGQDELLYDGSSFVLDKNGVCVMRGKMCIEDLMFGSIPNVSGKEATSSVINPQSNNYNALMLGLRDYVSKNGFSSVVLGLSGGIDSALVAALAVDALGADKVWCVMMPSPYTSPESYEDAEALVRALKCRYNVLPINDAMQAFDKTLEATFAGKAKDLTEENIQARCRGVLLMALSNKFGAMVLSTGNKSEMAVGYSTLYGDLCGGFAALKDVYKTEVYKLSHWRNQSKPVEGLGPTGAIIPERILTKAPTAELRPNQKDQDSLPPYDVLDAILEGLIEQDRGVTELIAKGFDAATVKRVDGMVQKAEYKRRQAPPGVKITARHMGLERRYPITNRYREV